MPGQVTGYSRFLRDYLRVVAIAAAAVPLALKFGNVPVMTASFDALVAAAASFGSFTVIGLCFYFRHSLAKIMFWKQLDLIAPNVAIQILIKLAPIIFTLTGICLLFLYYIMFNAYKYDMFIAPNKSYIERDLLFPALFGYVFGFIFLTGAISLMATREYLQEQLHVDDMDLILGASPSKRRPAGD